MSRTPFLILLFMFSAFSAFASEGTPRVRIVWIDSPPRIDGRLDDEVWQAAPQIEKLTQVQPVQGAEPTQKTEVWIATDGKTLYLAIRCHDTNPELIVANRMLRDDFYFWDDRITFAFDTFHDRRNGYVFEINPLGGRHDILVEGSSFEGSWDTIWEVETSIDANGWSVEFAIPFQSLNFDPEGDTWGFNFSRGIRRNNEDMRWSDPYPQRFVSDLGRAGVLEGMRGVEQGLGLEIVPSLTLGHVEKHDENPVTNIVRHSSKTRLDPSIDVFYKLLPSLTASVTAYTSFDETEADLRQLNLTRFNLFFPEKRKFFLQDALIFDFAELSEPQNRASVLNGKPFFSRRIGVNGDEPVDILVSGKVTGRVDRFKIGVLHSLVDSRVGIAQQNLTVGRIAMNLLGESSLGVIATHGDPDGRVDNTVVGTDFIYRDTNFRRGKALGGTAWYQHSFTQGDALLEEEVTSLRNGDAKQNAYGWTLEYPNDLVNWKLGFRGIEKNFNPELGFVNRRGIRQYDGEYRNRIRRGGWLRTFDTTVSGLVVTDASNKIETGKFSITPVAIATDIGEDIEFSYSHHVERPRPNSEVAGDPIAVRSYTFDRGSMRLSTSRNRQVRGEVHLEAGSYYDGHLTSVAPEIEWRPSRHWLFLLHYEFNDIRLPDNRRQSHLVRLRVNVQFTPEASWITLVQYDNDTDSVGINSRLRWIIQDGREFFIVFNQGLDVKGGVHSTRSEPLIKGLWTVRF
jgi:hypothetical protein